jgi:hypothetical protein
MIVVEAGHVHVMKFLPLSCELSIFVNVTVFFFVFLFKLTIESKSIELFCTQFNFDYRCHDDKNDKNPKWG